jgi:magnesium transporter
MKDKLGIIINRLSLGFIFAFLYQIVVAIATSLFSLPLTGNVQDLLSGIDKIDSGEGLLFIVWWIISTIIITAIALFIVKNRRYISPYKEEKNINIPPKITILSAVVIGAILSFWFFLLDTVIGFFTVPGSQTDFNAIYEAASAGDFGPLSLSIIFSIAAGFIIVGIASKTSIVKEITEDIGIKKFAELGKLLTKKSKNTTTFADTVGLSPGALVHVGEKKVEKIKFSVIHYDEKEINEKQDASLEECLDVKKKSGTSWINISGIHDPNVIENIGKYFGLHSLVQSDTMNTEIRPKFVNHEDYLQIILKIPHFNNNEHELELEQITLIVGENFLLTFQETEGDIFEPIRKRLREGIGKIREWKSDYLSYAITDNIVDYFYVIMEDMDSQTDTLEEKLIRNPNPDTLQHIQRLKRELAILRKTIWPTREVIDGLDRSPSPLIANETKTYLKDVYSHTIQVMDTIESLREVVGGMMDTYLSSLSNRMNEVMKTLTIIASIFIPITFIAGIYGTNFEYIPELGWQGSYFVMLAAMVMIAIIMIAYFKKKQWL